MPSRKLLPFSLFIFLGACASQPTADDALMSNAMCSEAKVLLATHKNGEARDLYMSAVSRDNRNTRAWNGLGVAEELLGKKDEAADAYKHALALTPDDPTVVNNLAHLDAENGNPDAAVSLLEPFANDPSVSPILKQNLLNAQNLVHTKQAAASDIYADLGSYPTQAMAEGHIAEVRSLLNDNDVNFAVVSDVKIGGGTPVFTLKATGRSPQLLCDELNAKAFPCIPQGH